MAMIQCKECGADVSSEAVTCPSCGVRLKPKAKIWRWVLGVPVGLFVLMMVIGTMGSNPERVRDRDAYAACMDSLKSSDRARDGSGGFIAGACERMRDKFIEKWGTSP